MSIHVCECVRNGQTEYHLRYPGMSEASAQGIADQINAGALDRAPAKEGPASDSLQEALVLALASIAANQGSTQVVYATEVNGKAYAVTVETEERFNSELPVEGTLDADNAIKAMLAERGWPNSSMNAARAGWRAARTYVVDPAEYDDLTKANVQSINDHMAYTCTNCGSVNFALLRSGNIECNQCGKVLENQWNKDG